MDSKSRADAGTRQAREPSCCHQAPSLSHPGGEGRQWWAGLAIFILGLGCGMQKTMQTEESSGLGQAQGWDWHGAGTGTGLGRY